MSNELKQNFVCNSRKSWWNHLYFSCFIFCSLRTLRSLELLFGFFVHVIVSIFHFSRIGWESFWWTYHPIDPILLKLIKSFRMCRCRVWKAEAGYVIHEFETWHMKCCQSMKQYLKWAYFGMPQHYQICVVYCICWSTSNYTYGGHSGFLTEKRCWSALIGLKKIPEWNIYSMRSVSFYVVFSILCEKLHEIQNILCFLIPKY